MKLNMNITEDEIMLLALKQLGEHAQRLERKIQKTNRIPHGRSGQDVGELRLVNRQRVEIAQQLYRKFRIQKDELYLPTWDKVAQAYKCHQGTHLRRLSS
jgi:hypothetical protein